MKSQQAAPQKLIDFVRASLQAGRCEALILRVQQPDGGAMFVDKWEARGKAEELVPALWASAAADADMGPGDKERRYEVVQLLTGGKDGDRIAIAFKARDLDVDAQTYVVNALGHVEEARKAELEERKEHRAAYDAASKRRETEYEHTIKNLREINQELREENKDLRKDSRAAHKLVGSTLERVTGRYVQIFDMHEELASDKSKRDALMNSQQRKDDRMDRITKFAEANLLPAIFGKLKEFMAPQPAPKQLPAAGATGEGGEKRSKAAPVVQHTAIPAAVTKLVNLIASLEPEHVFAMLSALPEDKAGEFMAIASELADTVNAESKPAQHMNGAAHA